MFEKLNPREYKYLGLDKWEKYQGKGIRVATMEAVSQKDMMKYQINTENETGGSHGKQTALTCLMTAPDVELYSYDITYKNRDNLLNKFKEDKIDIVFASLTNSAILYHDLESAGIITFVISGNNDNRPLRLAESRKFINVGGVTHTKRGIEFADMLFARHNHIDFASYGVIDILNIPKHPDDPVTMAGTSFSTPMMAGLSARVQQLCLEKTGRKLNQKEIYKFWLDNCNMEGLATNEVGNGVISLPDPETIDFNKYFDKIVVMPEVEEGDKMNFKDVDKKDWFYDSVMIVEKEGIMQGYEDGSFKPNHGITRAEVATIVARLLKRGD